MKSRGGRSGGGWGERFNPSGPDEEPTKIVLFHPQSDDDGASLYKIKLEREGKKPLVWERKYGVVFEHWNASANNGRGTSLRCTAGLQLENVPNQGEVIVPGTGQCVSCYEISSGANNISCRKLHLFNVVKLVYTHKVDSDRERKDGKGFYQEIVECTGKKCKLCKAGHERTFGRKMYWPLGPTHVEQLLDIQTMNLNRNCICGGRLKPRAFICPECEQVFRDLEEEPITEKGELKELRDQDYKCDKCNYEGPMVELPKCNKCKNPTPLTLWDVEMDVYKSGKNTSSVIQLAGFEPLTVERKAQLKELMRFPYDWDKVSRPLTLDQQAKINGVDNPFGAAGDDEEPGHSEWEEEPKSRRSKHDDDDDDLEDFI